MIVGETRKSNEVIHSICVAKHRTIAKAKQSKAMEHHENNGDDENVNNVAMNNEIGNNTGQIVHAYVFALADLERIFNQYHNKKRKNHWNESNELDNPAAAFCLNIVSSSIRGIPAEALYVCDTLTDVQVFQRGRRNEDDRILLRNNGSNAFLGCRKLRRHLLYIGHRAFSGCRKLRHINQLLKDGGVIRMEYSAFEGCGIEGELVIPCSVVFIGERSFFGCESITSVIFEPSTTGAVVVIKGIAFERCLKLLSVTLPPNLERIEMYCFQESTALINVPIPPSVIAIEYHAFARCTSLPSMDLPESITFIGDATFEDCTSLQSITIRSTAPSSAVHFGRGLFQNCTQLSIIRIRPNLWPNIFAAMNKDLDFLFRFFRKYHTTMSDEAERRTNRRRQTRRVITENQNKKHRGWTPYYIH